MCPAFCSCRNTYIFPHPQVCHSLLGETDKIDIGFRMMKVFLPPPPFPL